MHNSFMADSYNGYECWWWHYTKDYLIKYFEAGQSYCQELWRVDILLYVQANMHSSWMLTRDIRLLSQRKRTVYLLLVIPVAWISAFVPVLGAPIPIGGTGDTCTCLRLLYRKGAPSLGNFIFDYRKWVCVHFAPEGDITFIIWDSEQTFIFQGCLLYPYSWKDNLEHRESVPLSHKMYRNMRDPWRTVSQKLYNPVIV